MEVCEQISPSVSFSFSCGSGLHGSWEAGIDTAHCVKAWKSHPYNPAHWWGHWTDGKVEPRCKTLQVAHVSARSCGSIVLIPYKYRCTHTIWTWLRFTWINATQSLKGLLNSESDFAAKKKALVRMLSAPFGSERSTKPHTETGCFSVVLITYKHTLVD